MRFILLASVAIFGLGVFATNLMSMMHPTIKESDTVEQARMLARFEGLDLQEISGKAAMLSIMLSLMCKDERYPTDMQGPLAEAKKVLGDGVNLRIKVVPRLNERRLAHEHPAPNEIEYVVTSDGKNFRVLYARANGDFGFHS